jgi:hypothetical protein
MAVVVRDTPEDHVVKAAATDSVRGHQHMIQGVARAGLLRRSSPASRSGRSLLASSNWRNRRLRSRGDAAVGLRDRLAGSADRDR